jgi:hypothetical protein
MPTIDDIIKKNREAFSDSEPEAGHIERFRDKLETLEPAKEGWFQRYNIVLKIAAAIVVFIGITSIIYTDSFSIMRNSLTAKFFNTKIPQELAEVMQYYNVITDKKMVQIGQLAVSEDEAKRVKEKADIELKSLDESKNELEKEYAKNPGSERILNALMLNQRKRAEILDKILTTMKQIN